MDRAKSIVNKLLEAGPDDIDPQHYINQAATELNARLDSFTNHYIIAALWSSNGDDDEPLDTKYGVEDLAPLTRIKMARDCRRFQMDNSELLARAGDAEQNGHDFWLTRNGHGAGFWDRGYPEEIGDKLSEICRQWGEVYLYVGDDGLVHSDDERTAESLKEAAGADDVNPEHYLDWAGRKAALGHLKDMGFGFSISTSSEDLVKDNAKDAGIVLDDTAWQMLSNDFRLLEIGAIAELRHKGFSVRDEGHSYDSLSGSFWPLLDSHDQMLEGAFTFLKTICQLDEPISTSRGTWDTYFGAGSQERIWKTLSSIGQRLLDVDIEFYVDKVREWLELNTLGEAKDPDDIDPQHYLSKVTPYYCRQCHKDLTAPHSVIRTYVSKQIDGDVYSMIGHYAAAGDFTPDEQVDFEKLHGYDLLDDSDQCAHCGNRGGQFWVDMEESQDVDDPESFLRQDWRHVLEQNGFKFLTGTLSDKTYKAKDGAARIWVRISNEEAGAAMLEFRVSYSDKDTAGGDIHYINYSAYAHTRWLNVLLPKIEKLAQQRIAHWDSARTMAFWFINSLTLWTDLLKLQGLGEAVEDQRTLTRAQEQFVATVLENEESSIDYEKYLAQVEPKPSDHVPCGKPCEKCGNSCTYMHRRGDPFEHQHICQACDVAQFNALLDRL
jgi:hypothetical protein